MYHFIVFIKKSYQLLALQVQFPYYDDLIHFLFPLLQKKNQEYLLVDFTNKS